MVEYCKQIDAIHSFWASSLGCDRGSLAAPGLTICRKIAASSREKIFVFRRDEAYVVEVQEKADEGAIYPAVVDAIRAGTPDSLLERSFWAGSPTISAASIVGPAYVGYLYDGSFLPYHGASARVLTDEDEEALRLLAARCPAIEWEHSAIDFGQQPIFGSYVAGEIVSASSFNIWGGEIAHIGVISDPSYRGKGFGKATVSAACAEAIRVGLTPQYRTLESNEPSIGIALALGFEEYATTLSIILGSN